jgi:hypothetical protein
MFHRFNIFAIVKCFILGLLGAGSSLVQLHLASMPWTAAPESSVELFELPYVPRHFYIFWYQVPAIYYSHREEVCPHVRAAPWL